MRFQKFISQRAFKVGMGLLEGELGHLQEYLPGKRITVGVKPG